MNLRLPEVTLESVCKSYSRIISLLQKKHLLFTVILLLAIPFAILAQSSCPCTIWNPSTIPVTVADPDGSANELGVKFRSFSNGYITGIRFYKSSINTGTHIGNLWTSAGTNLAQAAFTGETASGWQQVTFANPVAIASGTTYVASYHTSTGHYSADENYFTSAGVVTTYLEALKNGTDGPNGVFANSPTTAFPTSTFNSSNYYVDVVFVTTLPPDNTPPSVVSFSPANGSTGISINTSLSAVFNEAIDPATINGSTFELRNASNVLVPATVSYNTSTRTALLTPTSALNYSSVYTAKLVGGTGSPVIKDIAGNALASNFVFSFITTGLPPSVGPGGPILVISAASNPFSRYPVEILRAEGFNNFFAMDISTVTSTVLNNYDVVVLGEIPLSSQNVTDLTNWTNAGGTLVALKPDAQLNTLLGLTAVAGSLSNGYLLVNTASGPGVGIVNQTIQFHGTSNLYTLNGATSLATLYSSATTATSNPAVTSRAVGSNGGMAVAFAYDLAKSVVYTRQGNPAWAGQKRDGTTGPIRSDDMFYPNWINLSKVAIPQADEQQHLLSNIIAKYTLDRKPLPRFWFLPKGLKAAVVMTGDDHGLAGPTTFNRFNQYKSLSADNSPTGVADWNAIRGTSYIFPGTPITDAQTSTFQADGFEIGLHLNTNCANWTASSWQNFWTSQYATLLGQLPSMLPQQTHRTHCVAWSDFGTQAKKQWENNVRLDVNYYYFPGAWVLDRPGMFTGSGMPMRFSDVDGTLIDCYQVTTQLTDESGQTLPVHISALLDSAIGAPGYYGVFCANMHTDNGFATSQSGSDAIVSAAQARSIPVISAKQMLDWLDGRNGSTFNNLVWNNNQLSFTITAAPGSRNMKAMLPVNSSTGTLNSITYNGSGISTTTQTIKGIVYAFFDATLGGGTYLATYLPAVPPVITNVAVIPNSNGSATITWNTAQIADSKVDYGTSATNLSLSASNASQVTSHTITLTGLTQGTIYYFRVTSKDVFLNSTTIPILTDPALNFVMPATPCAIDQTAANFNLGTKDANLIVALEGSGTVILNPSFIDEFSGSTLETTKWTSAIFNTGGTTTVSGGQVRVNGTHIYSNSSFGPGTSIEFLATFTAAAFQNIGFSSDQPFNSTPWVVIGQGDVADGNLYARSSDNSSVNLGSNLLGTSHRYRISWNTPANTFSFYVDGNLITTTAITMTVSTPMFIQVSDVVATGGILSVDWLRASPYPASGIFTSRVFNHGISANWGIINWIASTPTGTALAISARVGNTATPDGTWTAFTPLTNNTSVGLSGRYLQYRANLSNSINNVTPTLQQLSIACTDVNTSITITQHPTSISTCNGSTAVFISKATCPTPIIIQWQKSINGTTWADIFGENQDTLVLTTSVIDNGALYRAKWSNGSGTVNSNTAILTVNQVNSVSISKINVLCFGQSTGSITITNTGGTTPYMFSIDSGSTFSNSGTFSNLSANSYQVRVKDALGCLLDTTVIITQPIAISATIVKQNLACLGDANGSITVAGNGGVGPYSYSRNNGITYNSTGIFTGLTAGNYTIRIKDANNCLKDTIVAIDIEKATWTGAIDTDWHKAGNWNLQKVPTATTHVIIPSGTINECIISFGNAFASSVQVKTGATLRLQNNFKIIIQGKCAVLPPN